MSLDNIQLPSLVLQGLYKNCLIGLKNEQRTEVKTELKRFSTLGNNRRHVLILVESDETLYMADELLNFLMGILAACTLNMEDVAILNIKKNKSVTYKNLTNELKSEKIFLFGVTPSEIGLPLDFPNYQIQQFNGQTYLTAPVLSHIQNDKIEKTKLWTCLKHIFEIR